MHKYLCYKTHFLTAVRTGMREEKHKLIEAHYSDVLQTFPREKPDPWPYCTLGSQLGLALITNRNRKQRLWETLAQ